MNAAKMLARDLVLRVCASDAEFRRDWLINGTGPKRAVPLAVVPGPDPDLANAIAGAAAEMGARRLLACRTRAAFMYDTVTVLPASPQALLDLAARWGQPDDFLVCLPDESAAVLVSMSGYALGAGPPAFLAALAGPDVAGARERFAAWARETGDHRLRLVAGRYGSPPASRHAPRRQLSADLPERLADFAAAVRRWPALTAVLRGGRAAAGWGAVAVIVITLMSAPRSSHALPVLGGTLWLLFQVFALARTHTLSWPACLRMTAAGAVCAVALAAAEWLIAGPHVLHASPALTALGEELATLVPLAAFWAVARHRFARFAVVDYLLLGVASGAGFALAEGSAAALGAPGAGWHVAALLPGWADARGIRFPGQAVTTGVVAAGIGLAVAARAAGTDRPGSPWRWWSWLAWLLPGVLLGLVVLDHYHYDAVVAGVRVPVWVSRLHAAAGNGHASRWLLLALLAIAVAADFGAFRRAADVVPPLPGVPLWAGMARAARGFTIRMRAKPRMTARARLARRWAGVWAGAAEALVAGAHELAFLLVAARRPGSRGLFDASLRFARQRRELAVGEARARGRGRRDVPPRLGVWAAWRRIAGALGLAGPAAVLALPFAPALLARRSLLAPHVRLARSAFEAPGGRGGAGHAGYPRLASLADKIPALHAWFSQFTEAGQVLVICAGLSVIVVLGSGWSAPIPLRSRPGERSRGRLPRRVAAVPGPGQSALRVLRLGAWLLPPRTARLLAGEAVARPYQRDPHAPQAALPSGKHDEIPPSAAGDAVLAAPRRRAGRDELGRSGWMFPSDRVRRWVSHAPEFGVAPAPAGPDHAGPDHAGTDQAGAAQLGGAQAGGAQAGPNQAGEASVDTADLTARLTGVLREIAEGAGSLRFGEVTFRNHPARAVVDRASGGAVFFTPAGEFTGCAILTEEQLFRLVTELRL